MSPERRFYGKYRGLVLDNEDPMQTGRVQVQVPDVLGEALSSWALPCFPIAGDQMGFWSVPAVGAGVWVEFEQGDPDYPIWTGCWYGSAAEVPTLALATTPPLSSVFMQTTGQAAFQLSDLPGPTGGILLRTASGAMIMVNDIGITITNGQGATIVLAGPTVTINDGALVVT
jgi:uncharacterized protein involved in type VI secretion and phage assembly